MRSGGKISLRLWISVLFISVVLMVSATLTWQNYHRSSSMILTAAGKSIDQINKRLREEFEQLNQSTRQVLYFLSLSSLPTAQSFEQRLTMLPMLEIALQSNPHIAALQVGYDNGDYFIVRPCQSERIKQQFTAPEACAMIVDNVHNGEIYRLFYAENRQLISREEVKNTAYDPRLRPWYKEGLANDGAYMTEAYFFYFIRQVGVTLSLRGPESRSVIAADITLQGLSDKVSEVDVSPNTEIVVANQQGRVFIYRDPDKLVISNQAGGFELATLSQLDSDVLRFLSKDERLTARTLNFYYQQQKWIGAIRLLQLPDHDPYYVLMVSPEQELLHDVIAIRDQGLLISGVIFITFIPLIILFVRRIASPLNELSKVVRAISLFDFQSRPALTSSVREIEDLGKVMQGMSDTIQRFLVLSRSLVGESDFDVLLQRISLETRKISGADAVFMFLYNHQDNCLDLEHCALPPLADSPDIEPVSLIESSPFSDALVQQDAHYIHLDSLDRAIAEPIKQALDIQQAQILLLPVLNRRGQPVGMLAVLYANTELSADQQGQIAFVQALTGFTAASLESQQLLRSQKLLLNAFIKLIASAIDAKSPYTGNHCARVPELTEMLARAACDSKEAVFRDFQLTSAQWEELHIASWLHDCGKVTTPEFVIDKATKLETIYDRLHEIRMRFEVLKRDADIDFWQGMAEGKNVDELTVQLNKQKQQLDEDFAFVADCNQGREVLLPGQAERLQKIAKRRWVRTLDDRIGLAQEELLRKQRLPVADLPCEEPLLSDRYDHLIEHDSVTTEQFEQLKKFIMPVPEHRYNRGELYNLLVERGTLTEEERYTINNHIVQTIIMLEKLPYPEHLRNVPDIAGGHHEKVDGTGYPKGLTAEQMPLTARIMAIADVFEALTAADRPYKKPKKVSEAIAIMQKMADQKHIDAALWQLFLSSGIAETYAQRFLSSEQLDI
jgi:HD-GYP domain-containing protein (c-di-GMP phosphodiesterase class II)